QPDQGQPEDQQHGEDHAGDCRRPRGRRGRRGQTSCRGHGSAPCEPLAAFLTLVMGRSFSLLKEPGPSTGTESLRGPHPLESASAVRIQSRPAKSYPWILLPPDPDTPAAIALPWDGAGPVDPTGTVALTLRTSSRFWLRPLGPPDSHANGESPANE